MDIGGLSQLINQYLETVPDDDGGEIYGSWRVIASDELEKFLKWCQQEQEDEDG
jgi:hypothetical protein